MRQGNWLRHAKHQRRAAGRQPSDSTEMFCTRGRRPAAHTSPQSPAAFRSEADILDACERPFACLLAETFQKATELQRSQKSGDPGLQLQRSPAVQTAPAAWDSENNLDRDTASAELAWNPTILIHDRGNGGSLNSLNSVDQHQRVDYGFFRAVQVYEIANRHIRRTMHNKHRKLTMQPKPKPRKSQLGRSSVAL